MTNSYTINKKLKKIVDYRPQLPLCRGEGVEDNKHVQFSPFTKNTSLRNCEVQNYFLIVITSLTTYM